MGTMDTVLALGLLGVGGYFFITQIWPSLKDSIGASTEKEDVDTVIRPIVEDRFPDYVIEDTQPDIIIEDVVPDYYPAPMPYPQPYPVYIPVQDCDRGEYWDGRRCRRIECPPGYEWDDGECKIDCPPGYRRRGNNTCVPRRIDCDDDEYWDGERCRKLETPECPPGYIFRDGRCRQREIRCRRGYHNVDGKCVKLDAQTERRWDNGNARDRWHNDRDIEERIRRQVTPRTNVEIAEEKPAEERVKEITENAVKAFTEVWYA